MLLADGTGMRIADSVASRLANSVAALTRWIIRPSLLSGRHPPKLPEAIGALGLTPESWLMQLGHGEGNLRGLLSEEPVRLLHHLRRKGEMGRPEREDVMARKDDDPSLKEERWTSLLLRNKIERTRTFTDANDKISFSMIEARKRITRQGDSIIRPFIRNVPFSSSAPLPPPLLSTRPSRSYGNYAHFHHRSWAMPVGSRGIFTGVWNRMQKRRFWFVRNVRQLEEMADGNPEDARKQAALYRALIDEEPETVIKRFEDGRFGRDQECATIYLTALYETGQVDRAAKVLVSGNGGRAAGSGEGVKEGTNGSLLFNFGTKERPIYVHNAPQGGGWRRLVTVLNVLFVGAMLYSLFSMNDQRLGGISTKVHKFFKKDPATKTYTFDDVQGCDEAKHELEEIVEFLKSPAKFNKLGAKMPKGVLLVGPPGTGKTLLAKAVAGEADVPFIYASGSQFDEVFVGVGSMRIRQMFENAKEQAPCIIFIDEIDAIGSKRNPRDPQHSRMSLNQLLTELDGFSETQGIVVIAATNLPESLDKALLRPGRFDRHVYVSLPDVRGRKQILEMYLRDVNLATDVDIQLMARATPGFSGADLSKMINQAKISASVENGHQISMRHLEQAKDEMILGIERKSAIIEEDDRKVTAYHEGGHAIVALHTKYAHPIHKATIIPRGRALGMVSQLPERDELSVSRAQLLARMDVAMGGRVAEQLIFGDEHVTTGASSDFSQANAIARAMVTQYGMSEGLGPIVVNEEDWDTLSPQTRATIDAEIKSLLEDSRKRAIQILTAQRAQLDRLASALLEYETLTREEIEAVIIGKSLKLFSTSPSAPPSPNSPVAGPKLDLLY